MAANQVCGICNNGMTVYCSHCYMWHCDNLALHGACWALRKILRDALKGEE